MPDMDFIGTGKRLTGSDIQSAARLIGCDTATIRAVIEVECKGRGFDNQNRPVILYEPHIFARQTSNRFNSSHPRLSSRRWNRDLYAASQTGRYSQLKEAMQLDEQAALCSASAGLGQVMGFNWQICGYVNVQQFWQAMKQSEASQLNAMIRFIKANHLDDELRRHDWAGFARGYNGSAFRKNKYDKKLSKAYLKHATLDAGAPVTQKNWLKMGAKGASVRALQARLAKLGFPVDIDGDFGLNTKSFVIDFQYSEGLTADGIVGRHTRKALKLK